MLSKVYEVPEIAESAYRCILPELMDAVLRNLNLHSLIGENTVINSFLTAGQLAQSSSATLNLKKNYCKADVEIITNADDLPFGGRMADIYKTVKNNPTLLSKICQAIYLDNEDLVYLFEVPMQTGFSFNVELGFTSVTDKLYAAQRFRNALTNGLMTSDLQYSYLVPEETLCDVVTLYQKSLRPISEFKDFLYTNSNEVIDIGENKYISSNKAYLATRALKDITLKFDNPSGLGDHEGNSASPDTHKLSFTFTTQFDIVNTLILWSEIVIKNQYVEDVFRPIPLNEYQARLERGYSPALSMQEYNEYHLNPTITDVYRAPWYDTWSPDCFEKYVPIAQAVVQMDALTSDEFKTTINIIRDFNITQPNLLDILKRSGKDVFKLGSPFYVGVYHNNTKLTSDINFEYDPETTDFTIYGIGVSGVYRVVLCLNNGDAKASDLMRILNFKIIGD